MIRTITAWLFLVPVLAGNTTLAQDNQLRISPDNRFIRYADGRPFFWLGDTAWELFHRLNREEADLYLENRAAKGFTVIQAVVLAELDGLNTPNPYGERPLVGNDPARPNEAYFRHVDYIVDKATRLGMFIGMLPTWGDKFNKIWGVGPEVFTVANAETYGEFLGKRYRDKNIIWILGGDRPIDTPQHREIVAAMARGLKKGDGGRHLMTYHPSGGRSSSEWWHQEKWLDLNMFQSGHGEIDNPNYRFTERDYGRSPIKPVLDGEPCYEDHPINWRAENGWFDEFDSRRAGWWSMLSGACGHTYGNHNIWQMWQAGRNPISQARTPWFHSIDYPGAFQAGYMRSFFEPIAWQSLLPAQSIVKQGPNTGGPALRAAAAQDGSLVVVYTPNGHAFSLEVQAMAGKKMRAQWFNPRNNSYIRIWEGKAEAVLSFDPPADPKPGNDWVLLLTEAP